MHNWKHKVRVKDLLSGEPLSPEKTREVGQAIAARLRAKSFMADFDYIADFETAENEDELNEFLGALYDYADANDIWVE